MSVRSIALVVVAAVSGCTTDDKGLSCALADVYIDANGKAWCPDPAAQDDCGRVRDAMVAAFVRCDATDDDATAAAERTFDCSTAVTTTTSLNDCLAALDDDNSCLATAADLPDTCVGAVVLQAG